MRYLLPDGQYIGSYQPFTFKDVQYPANWLQLATAEDKERMGIVPVVESNERADDRFYNVSESVEGAVITYLNTPKDLDQLKSTEISKVNATAYSLLLPTDFMDFRPNYTPPIGWLEWREEVRKTCSLAKVAIKDCKTVEELIVLPQVVWPIDPNYIEPVVEQVAPLGTP